MAHPNEELIERFYSAFARGDGDAMAACYAPGARFSDPALGPAGLALGWTPFLRGKVQREARASLDEFLGNRS